METVVSYPLQGDDVDVLIQLRKLPYQAYSTKNATTYYHPLLPYRDSRIGEVLPRLFDGVSLLSFMRARGATVPTNFVHPSTHAGQYHPRIRRSSKVIESLGDPVLSISDTPDFPAFVSSLEQIESLFAELSAVFQVVHPVNANLEAYGSSIRELLILACTEVESQWRGVLKANGSIRKNDRFKTTDYVRLLPVMKLSEFAVKLRRYPHVDEIRPFGTWSADDATQSLPWYDAYNAVKHDREDAFHRATLRNAIDSVAACYIMLVAQYGRHDLKDHQLDSPFSIFATPDWEPRDFYYEPIPGDAWQAVNHPDLESPTPAS